jgi:hypothetical protein
MNMRSIFKLLDMAFILLGLPYLYYLALHIIHQGLGFEQDGLFLLFYLLIAITNYRDKWNEKEKKGMLTYPLLAALVLYHFFEIKVAFIGGALALVIVFFKRFSTVFVSGSLLALWSLSYIESGSIRSLWNSNLLQDYLFGWKLIFPLLGGWIYLIVMGRFYPKTVKNVHKKPNKWFRWKLPVRLLKRMPSVTKTVSFLRRRDPSKRVTDDAESVPVQQVVELIQEMTKEKGLQWTSAATETLSDELQHLNTTRQKDRFNLWAKKFVEALNVHHGSFIIDTQTVNQTLERIHNM